MEQEDDSKCFENIYPRFCRNHINIGIIRTFGVIDKAPLEVGTGAVLCMAEQFGAFDRDNLIVPVWMI